MERFFPTPVHDVAQAAERIAAAIEAASYNIRMSVVGLAICMVAIAVMYFTFRWYERR